ncbi:MAG: hypothetical protein L0154_20955 [Chloroflexi bacterium]|nr:hypothetical protein [Chloroflexota bacterium]
MDKNAMLAAGAISGIIGLLVFLTIHHFWIRPIWFIFPPGLFIAVLGGLAVGWSYMEISAGLPPRPWTTLAVVALIGAILTPAILLAHTRPSPFDPITGNIIPGKGRETLVRIIFELLLTAMIVGGLAGWWIGGSPKAALATALAGLVFAIGPGHNIPLLGNTPSEAKGLIILLVIVMISALTLVEGSALLMRV